LANPGEENKMRYMHIAQYVQEQLKRRKSKQEKKKKNAVHARNTPIKFCPKTQENKRIAYNEIVPTSLKHVHQTGWNT
jgi:hypothetical protein